MILAPFKGKMAKMLDDVLQFPVFGPLLALLVG
jgi:hypothetical protein